MSTVVFFMSIRPNYCRFVPDLLKKFTEKIKIIWRIVTERRIQPMKLTRRRQTWKRAGAVLLATLLTFGSLPEYDLVVHAQEQTEASPESEETKAEPEETKAESEETKAESEETKAEPEETKAEPEETKAEPEAAKAESEAAVEEPAEQSKSAAATLWQKAVALVPLASAMGMGRITAKQLPISPRPATTRVAIRSTAMQSSYVKAVASPMNPPMRTVGTAWYLLLTSPAKCMAA